MKNNATHIDNTVYKNIKGMERESILLRYQATNGDVGFDRSQEMRKDQDKLYKKSQFYKNVVDAIKKKEMV